MRLAVIEHAHRELSDLIRIQHRERQLFQYIKVDRFAIRDASEQLARELHNSNLTGT